MQVFISHYEGEKRDLDFVESLDVILRVFGFDVLISERQVIQGKNWEAIIEDMIEKSFVTIAVISQDTIKSTWVWKEIRFATKRNKPVIPIYIDSEIQLPKGTNLTVGELQHFEFINGVYDFLNETNVAKLVSSLSLLADKKIKTSQKRSLYKDKLYEHFGEDFFTGNSPKYLTEKIVFKESKPLIKPNPVVSKRFRDPVLYREFNNLASPACDLSWAVNSKDLAIAFSNRLMTWNIKSDLKLEYEIFDSAKISCINYSPQDFFLGIGGDDGSIVVYNLKPRTKRMIVAKGDDGHSSLITCVNWSPSSKQLATADVEGKIKIWNYNNNNLLFERNLEWFDNDTVWDISFDESGKRLVAGSQDGEVVSWNLDDNKAVELAQQLDGVVMIKWLRGGADLLLTSSFAGDYKILDLNKGQVEKENKKIGNLYTCDYSSNNELLVFSDGLNQIRIWSIITDSEVLNFTGHDKAIRSLAWSPDGKFLASSSDDKTVRIWTFKEEK